MFIHTTEGCGTRLQLTLTSAVRPQHTASKEGHTIQFVGNLGKKRLWSKGKNLNNSEIVEKDRSMTFVTTKARGTAKNPG